MVYEVEGYPDKTSEGWDRRFTVFRRSFWAFGASIEEYRHCKPVLSVDEMFLSGKVRGVLLVAITCDADNQLVPLAFGLVEREDNSNWKWFLTLLRVHVLGADKSPCIISARHPGIINAMCMQLEGEDNQLLKGINSYRASLKVPALTENSNADCLAEQLAKKFKGQECTNTTGANTVPGTEPQFPDYPQFLNRCHLNASVTEDGQVMPACVPGLVADVVLTNYTKSQYNRFLNDTKYSGVGIANEGDWVVVVLSTSTDSGDYSPAPPGSNWAPSVQPFSWMIVSLAKPCVDNFIITVITPSC
ncbi:hypothetical protein TRIUR3_23618 [Triticum urartu]|uniref:Uncharacterized protein n=1 Tax=Triticum urartu TaxID=4572 RepID=M7YS79_TRIUA|nr:hypothetical protein TRIUR3_23618 [Triticum urartu]